MEVEYPRGIINLRTLSAAMELFCTILSKLLEALFSTYITIVLILPVCSIVGLVNEMFRAVIAKRLKDQFGGRYELVSSGADNIWSIKKTGNSRNILLLTIFDGTIELKTYRREFQQRILDYKDKNGEFPYRKLCKVFTQAFGYCCWKKDDEFSLDRHIRLLDPPHIRAFYTESDLPKILSDMTVDMSDEHPQWEEIMFPFVYDKDVTYNEGGNWGGGETIYSLNPGGKIRSAKLLRLHHAYMDQFSALALTKSHIADQADRSLRSETSSTLEKIQELLQVIAFGSSKLIKSWMEESNCFSQFCLPQFSGQKLHGWSVPIDIHVLNTIKSHTGCSVEEILTSALGGSLRLVSEKYCKKPEWLIFCDTFEDSVFLGMPSPIVPFPSDAPVNKCGMSGFLMNTEALSSRLQRLKSVRDAYRRKIASSPAHKLHYLMLSFFGRFPSRFIQYFFVESGAPVLLNKITMPELDFNTKVSITETPVEEIAYWMPLLNCTGLNISVCKYANQIRITGVGESSRVSSLELEFILQQIPQEIILIAQECGLKAT